jgi:hypothetical protein
MNTDIRTRVVAGSPKSLAGRVGRILIQINTDSRKPL